MNSDCSHFGVSEAAGDIDSSPSFVEIESCLHNIRMFIDPSVLHAFSEKIHALENPSVISALDFSEFLKDLSSYIFTNIGLFFNSIPPQFQDYIVRKGGDAYLLYAAEWITRQLFFSEFVSTFSLQKLKKINRFDPHGFLALTFSGSFVTGSAFQPTPLKDEKTENQPYVSYRGVSHVARPHGLREGSLVSDVVCGAPVTMKSFRTGPIVRLCVFPPDFVPDPAIMESVREGLSNAL